MVAMAALPVAVCVVAWIWVYAPLVTKVKSKTFQCVQMEDRAAQARRVAVSSWGAGRKLALIRENEISPALDEMTRKGKEAGVNFVSITPHLAVKPEGSSLRVLPVELETKSAYQSLGMFLGDLQEMDSAFLTIRHFEVKVDPSNPAQVVARIALHLYLSD